MTRKWVRLDAGQRRSLLRLHALLVSYGSKRPVQDIAEVYDVSVSTVTKALQKERER